MTLAREKIEEMQQSHQALKIQFIRTELEMAVTFCEVARSTGKKDVARRNLGNAKKACEAVAKVLQKVLLDERESQEISEQREKIRLLIAEVERTTQ